MTTTETTFVRGGSARGKSKRAIPFHVPTDVPFVLLKRPPVDHGCGDFAPNWDGTTAQSSGTRGRTDISVGVDTWRLHGGSP